MTAQEMWACFAKETHIQAEYDAWAFGDDPDALAQLVLSGRKTATSSAYAVYAPEEEPLPQVGEYSVILNSREEAVCIIRTTAVGVVPFQDVGCDHARKEGEGDCLLPYWRAVHRSFFTKELARIGLPFDEAMKVVCEEFQVVWPTEEYHDEA